MIKVVIRMYNQNLYYPKYYPNFVNPYNNYAYYNPPAYTAFYQPYTNNLPNYNYIKNNNTKDSKVTNDATLESNFALQNNNEDKQDDSIKNKRKENFRLGPIDISKDKLSIFGFEIAIDDLILIALILFLFFETDCDYSILIVLGLMLFNVSFSSLDLF